MSNPFEVGDLVTINHHELRKFVGNADPVMVIGIINDSLVCLAEDNRSVRFPKEWHISHLTFRGKAHLSWMEDAFYEETPEIAEIRAAFNNGEVNVGS